MRTLEGVPVLVTGGAGFIGRHLVAALGARGARITVVDAFVAQVHGEGAHGEAPSGVELIVGDVTDPVAVSRALGEAELVFHLAAETGTGQSMYEVRRYSDVNIGGTATLIESLAARRRPAALVLASSRAVYGEGAGRCARCGSVALATRSVAALARGEWWSPCASCGGRAEAVATPEGFAPRPVSVYGVTKHAQEELIRVAAASGTVRGMGLRLQNVYGRGQTPRNPYTGVLVALGNRLRRQQGCELFEDGAPVRDFVHVDDVVAALLRAGQSALAMPAGAWEILNVGSGEAVTISRAATLLANALGVSDPARALVVTGAYRAGDIRHAVAELSNVRARLGWQPTVALARGIADLAAWLAESEPVSDALADALVELKSRGLGG